MRNKFIIAAWSNINSPEGFYPIENCNKAINELSKFNIKITQKSSWYLSEPIPKSSQPKYYNSVFLCNSKQEIDILYDYLNQPLVLKMIQSGFTLRMNFIEKYVFDYIPNPLDSSFTSFILE